MSFRLSVSVALLVSSAGLAASLLVSAAIGTAGPQTISWQPTSRLSQPASELPGSPLPSEPALPESLSSLVPAYVSATSTTVSTPPTSPAGAQLHEQLASAEPTFLPTASSLKSTVQHSWHTFKQAFR